MSDNPQETSNNPMIPFDPDMFDLGLNTVSTVYTTEGQAVDLPEGTEYFDLIPGSGADFIVPRLAAGQPKEKRWPEAANQIFALFPEKGIDEVTGKVARMNTFEGPFGDSIQVRVIGYTANRAFMPEWDDNAAPKDRRPLCRSENMILPDKQFVGKFSQACCLLNEKTRQLEVVCPYAQWGEKKADGKSEKPLCSEAYILAVAFRIAEDQPLELFEVYFRSSSAKTGQLMIDMLRGMKKRSIDLWSFPVELSLRDAGQGNAFIAQMIAPRRGMTEKDVRKLLPTPEELAEIQTLVPMWDEAMRYRKNRSNESAPTLLISPVTTTEISIEPPAQVAAPQIPETVTPVEKPVEPKPEKPTTRKSRKELMAEAQAKSNNPVEEDKFPF